MYMYVHVYVYVYLFICTCIEREREKDVYIDVRYTWRVKHVCVQPPGRRRETIIVYASQAARAFDFFGDARGRQEQLNNVTIIVYHIIS